MHCTIYISELDASSPTQAKSASCSEYRVFATWSMVSDLMAAAPTNTPASAMIIQENGKNGKRDGEFWLPLLMSRSMSRSMKFWKTKTNILHLPRSFPPRRFVDVIAVQAWNPC